MGMAPVPGRDRRSQIAAALRPPAARYIYFAPNSRDLKPEVVENHAEDVARKLASVPMSQLRRFYNAVMALTRRAELQENLSDTQIRAMLMMLKVRAGYTAERHTKYPIELVEFFTRHAHAVQTRDDLVFGFQPHFEAVMGYHRIFETGGDKT